MRKDLSKIIKKKYDELDERLVYCEDEDIRPIVYTQKILNDILEELSWKFLRELEGYYD